LAIPKETSFPSKNLTQIALTSPHDDAFNGMYFHFLSCTMDSLNAICNARTG
jgi:hypothetical protein